jgi:hypothetical protein
MESIYTLPHGLKAANLLLSDIILTRCNFGALPPLEFFNSHRPKHSSSYSSRSVFSVKWTKKLSGQVFVT